MPGPHLTHRKCPMTVDVVVVAVVMIMVMFSSVQLLSCSCPTLCDPVNHSTCPSPTPGVYPDSLSIESVMPSNCLILYHPLLLPAILPSIRVFSNELALHIRWPKYWSFSFNISPSNEHPGLISFRMDWLDLLVAALITVSTGVPPVTFLLAS